MKEIVRTVPNKSIVSQQASGRGRLTVRPKRQPERKNVSTFLSTNYVLLLMTTYVPTLMSFNKSG